MSIAFAHTIALLPGLLLARVFRAVHMQAAEYVCFFLLFAGYSRRAGGDMTDRVGGDASRLVCVCVCVSVFFWKGDLLRSLCVGFLDFSHFFNLFLFLFFYGFLLSSFV